MLVAPVSSTKDISEDIQLKGRNFWVSIDHPELGEALPYCGPFIRLSESPIEFNKRAPLTGEHNTEVFGKELGLTPNELKALKVKGVI
jgi:crotonobetainyl-CoA:carnitine CoA-transferase CaiB-like acyl-CoA transferase